MKNKYNIITTCDKSYFLFAKILINSILDKCNLSLIDTIFIVDTGLDDDQLDYFKNRSPLISFVKTGLKTNFDGGTWGNDWQLNVRSKTQTLYHIIDKTKTPTLMLDSDMMVLDDLSKLLDAGGDIQVCVRERGVRYIGSYFFGLNPLKSLPFVKEWSLVTNSQQSKTAIESPSLVYVVDKNKASGDLSIVERSQDEVNIDTPEALKENTLIAHFKGSRLSPNIEESMKLRVFDRGWQSYVEPYLT